MAKGADGPHATLVGIIVGAGASAGDHHQVLVRELDDIVGPRPGAHEGHQLPLGGVDPLLVDPLGERARLARPLSLLLEGVIHLFRYSSSIVIVLVSFRRMRSGRGCDPLCALPYNTQPGRGRPRYSFFFYDGGDFIVTAHAQSDVRRAEVPFCSAS